MENVNPANFFQWQKNNRRRSVLFYIAFGLSAMAWFVALYYGAFFLLEKRSQFREPTVIRKTFARRLPPADYNASIKLGIVALAFYVFASSLLRVDQIRRNGSSFVATALGGIPLGDTETVLGGKAGQERERILRNVISEMCLAAGVSEPDIYILPNENGVNAMAAGLSLDDAAIALTKGALKYLSRDELSGVIGHELSHILNGDMRHNTIMSGWLHGFFSLTTIGANICRHYVLVPVSALLISVGFLGSLTGKILQSAFNRSRESLADAYSVQFTRDPTCLARALIKIGGLDDGGYLKTKKKIAFECRHLYIAESIKSHFQTHPPLAERVWALDPSWSGHWHDFETEPVDYLAEKA
jgi:Zn-dependent protease with chaperone function